MCYCASHHPGCCSSVVHCKVCKYVRMLYYIKTCRTLPIVITRKIIFTKCTATYGKYNSYNVLSPITLDYKAVLQFYGWNFTHLLFHIIAE